MTIVSDRGVNISWIDLYGHPRLLMEAYRNEVNRT